MTQQILHRDDLQLGGFAGIREHRLVIDPKVFGNDASGAWSGIGNFVYLADAKFIPHGETNLHSHKEIDVISVMVEGKIEHGGTLQEGSIIEANQVQVQRAGREGFAHNEVNPDNKENRMIQMWITPENIAGSADYKFYSLYPGNITRVYGGDANQDETFSGNTVVDIGLIDVNQSISFDGEFLAYVTVGSGVLNGETVSDGDLIRGNGIRFQARENSQIIIVRKI